MNRVARAMYMADRLAISVSHSGQSQLVTIVPWNLVSQTNIKALINSSIATIALSHLQLYHIFLKKVHIIR